MLFKKAILPVLWIGILLLGCSPNHAPEFVQVGVQDAVVGIQFVLRIQAFDLDGDQLSYDYSSPTLTLKDRARLINLVTEVRFTWTPLASDVGVQQVDFKASDGTEEVTLPVTIRVSPGSGLDTAPVFRKPLGEGMTMDLSKQKCLKLEVLVEDPDDTKVDLRQLTAISGSTFSSTGDRSAVFSWCPTTAQAATKRWVLQLKADDHDNPPVLKNYTVLISSISSTKIPCTTSAQCPLGQVCFLKLCEDDACTPKDTNGDKFYNEQGTCPAGHFCAMPGPTLTSSHCALSCKADSDCQKGAKCKVFDTEKGCGQAGTKVTGRECKDFTECQGKAMCLPWKGGYCAISDCDSSGGFSGACPTGSACIPLADARFTYLKFHWLCLQQCKDNSNCRTGDGYTCKSVEDDISTTRKVCKL